MPLRLINESCDKQPLKAPSTDSVRSTRSIKSLQKNVTENVDNLLRKSEKDVIKCVECPAVDLRKQHSIDCSPLVSSVKKC